MQRDRSTSPELSVDESAGAGSSAGVQGVLRSDGLLVRTHVRRSLYTLRVAAPPATGDSPPRPRRRGPGRQPRSERPGQVRVIVLPLLVEGAGQRRRLERLFGAMYSIKRALRRDVRARLHAYWACSGRLRADAGAWRDELCGRGGNLKRSADEK